MVSSEHWQAYWQEALDDTLERSPEYDTSEYYRSGRASKQWPDKEGPEWWHENGPKFVKSWQKWVEHSGLKLWEFPDDDGVLQPGIEVECWAYGPNGLIVRSFIDRVFQDADGKLYIVDLKTGSHTPPWPLQLALNKLCLSHEYGEVADFGGYWKARSGGIHPKWFDLSVFTDEWLWDQVGKAREIRDQQLFLASPNNLCTSACGVAKFCVPMGGISPVSLSSGYGATMTHNNIEEGAE